ncbi:MAG: DUF4198 domain-containing protein [Peptococcaceae bacterium]|nr:DUF4198 domain-containing protein [Peptococcaceae bacterium]
MEDVSPEVVKGYSVWLEPESLHYHAGGVVQARVLWGYMMQRKGTADTGGWNCYALDPGGSLLEADVSRGEGGCHKAAFFAGGEGLYNLVLENEAGVFCRLPGGEWVRGGLDRNPGAAECARFFQRARIPVPVGHHIHGRLDNLSAAGLDVFSREFREYRLGDSIVIKVCYMGRPLPGACVKATHHLFAGGGYPWSGKTGKEGEISFTLAEKGHWMFTCTLSDEEDRGENRYHKTVHTASFVVAGVR